MPTGDPVKTARTDRRGRPDGRAARLERTRTAIVAALRSLLDAGELRPTTEAIAARAGVSERSIFQHFPDREMLMVAIGEHQLGHISALVRPISPDIPLARRLDEVAGQRASIWEEVTPVRRAALLNEPFSASIHESLRGLRAITRDEIGRVFARELDTMPANERQTVHEAMAAVAEWPFWESLRAHQGLSVPEATTALRRALAALVGAA